MWSEVLINRGFVLKESMPRKEKENTAVHFCRYPELWGCKIVSVGNFSCLTTCSCQSKSLLGWKHHISHLLGCLKRSSWEHLVSAFFFFFFFPRLKMLLCIPGWGAISCILILCGAWWLTMTLWGLALNSLDFEVTNINPSTWHSLHFWSTHVHI